MTRAFALARRPVGNAAHKSIGGKAQAGYLLNPAVVEVRLEHPLGGDAQPEAAKDRLAQALRRCGPHTALEDDDALVQVDLVVNAADVLTVASPTPSHKHRAAAGHAAAMVAFAAGLLVAALGAGADEPGRSYPVAGRGGTDGIHRQPTAQQSAPPNQLPNQLDVSANHAGTVDGLYRLLMGPQPTIFSDSLPSTPPSSSAQR